MLNLSRLETRFQEIIFLLTMTASLSTAVGGLFYLTLSSAGFLSAAGGTGSYLIQGGFSLFGVSYFLMVLFMLHMGHLFLATAHTVSDVQRNSPIYLRSSLIYSTLLLLAASFVTVLESYNQWEIGTHFHFGYGGWFGTVIGGFLFRNFGLYGALVLLFSVTSVIGISAGYMDIVHSFYVMREILTEIFQKIRHNGPSSVREMGQKAIDFLDQRPQFNKPAVASANRSVFVGQDNIGSTAGKKSWSTDHFHVPLRPLSLKEIVENETQIEISEQQETQLGQVGLHSQQEQMVETKAVPRKKEKRVASQDQHKEEVAVAAEDKVEAASVDAPLAVEIPSWTKRYKSVESTLLDKAEKRKRKSDQEMIETCQSLGERLLSFGIKGEVVAAHQGVTLTMFEFMPAAGMKLSKIQSLSDDLALVLGAESIRILAPIPGKTTVGIEVPNTDKSMLRFSEMIDACLKTKKMELPVPLGLDVYNKSHVSDLAKMPHLLVSGTTGSGKSVFMNSLISGLIFHKSPKELRFLMIDPKMIELSPYNGIPHLLKPVVTDVEEARDLLIWAEKEMDRRYQIFAETQSKSITTFNQTVKKSSKRAVEGRLGKKIEWKFEEMPYIVIVIDELADLMLTQRQEVERPITRIAQKARAAGIHMVMATQRPSSDIVTGLIKTNFPTRVSFKVSSGIDSRTILDQPGAEKLLGNGDMLFMAQGKPVERLQGSYMSEEEVKKVVRAVSSQK